MAQKSICHRIRQRRNEPNALKESYNGKDYRRGTKAMQKEFPFRVKGYPQTPPADNTNYFYLPQ
uniref:hypothetical protein n=1 Tax=Hoylesella pleuritidis TaxID=407975 RepID=UPI001F56FB80|nr:hypothetical protein [Hoylesella pleuritidis]